jgi:hypothetical protein
LGKAINLVVIVAVGKSQELMLEFGEPIGVLRK